MAKAHITFIHGLANKPPHEDLLRMWIEALADPRLPEDPGLDPGAVGITTSLVYWADLFYDTPVDPDEYETVGNEAQELEMVAATIVPGVNSKFLRAYGLADEPTDDDEGSAAAPGDAVFERFPLPRDLKLKLLRMAAREAHDYFRIDIVRAEIRRRVLEDFAAVPPGTRHVVVGHSQGSFIAYDVLARVAECKEIDALMTVGSPLGVDEIQDELGVQSENAWPAKLRGDWVNVYDPLDLVSRLDPQLRNDFKRNGGEAVLDIEESNEGWWRHSATKYFRRPLLRGALRRLAGLVA